MKRTPKWVFFVVFLLIAGLTYTSFFGVYKYFGDRRDTVIRSAADIRFGIDIRGGVDVTFGPKDEGINADESQVNAIKTVIEQRLVSKNITDYECYADVNNQQVIVRFPWQSDEADYDATAAIEELGETAQLEFHIGTEKTGDLVLDGTGVAKAEAMWQQDENQSGNYSAVVRLTLQGDAIQAFSDATQQQYENNQGQISIWLDDTMISAPAVQAHITDGTAIISGGTLQSYTDAQELANKINAGALPFDIEAKSYSTLSPTLGEKALEAMVIAGLIAFIIVAAYVIFWYRLPGGVAVIALCGQIAATVAAISGYFAVFDSFTLTLPGIAGILLSIGIGIDANVITSERVREEIRRGKTIDGAIRAGSKNSFWAIFDGNITVLIVAIVLMGVFGPPQSFWATILSWAMFMFPASTTGMVYSFGYTLFVGVVLNFVMGVALSRLMLRSVSRLKIFRNPWLYGGERK
ncbi:MAG: SecD/SecF family protein translocase subunit [Clostridia bacterium]|nr:SecD/SecF family protein translocase subunit [Clostridia bacterium]